MPTRVTRVHWNCARCGKHRWMRPCDARFKTYCSRACLYGVQRKAPDENPAPELVRTYGERDCAVCSKTFVARFNHQKCCSQECSVRKAQQARRKHDPTVQNTCEVCGKMFHPRPRGVGRFCSNPCRLRSQHGATSGSWRGGRHRNRGGYIAVWIGAGNGHRHGNYALEHRVVMESILGRRLTKRETVHHINGDRADNRPENLQLRSGPHGKGTVLACGDCGSRNIISAPLPTGADLLNARGGRTPSA